MLRVMLDGCCLGRRKTGNETYIRGLLQGFAELASSELALDVITTSHNSDLRSSVFSWHDIPLGNFVSRNFRTIPRLLGNIPGSPLYHATYWARFWSMPAPYVVTIHDISFASFPEGFKTYERLVYTNLIRAVARRARHVITISEYSRQDMMDRWGIPADQITSIPLAFDPCFQPATAPASSLNTPYILYVGNLHPRKNLVRLLEAFVRLKQESPHPVRLKIVGQKAWLYGDIFETVRKYQLEDQVDFTGYISQPELVRFYQEALFSVYPSLFEGFGIPVLEAMACGCPVIASTTTSVPEVAGDAARLVNPTSTDEIANAMHALLVHPEERAKLRAKGLKQVSHFSWRNTAEKTLAVYRSVRA